MNLYDLLNISNQANLIEICEAFKVKCLNNPSQTFTYTKAFKVLINPLKRMFNDAFTFQVNLPILFQSAFIYEQYQNIDEFELITFIEWLSDFQNFFYDTKYFTTNKQYHSQIEEWYNTIEEILEKLKNHIKSMYLI